MSLGRIQNEPPKIADPHEIGILVSVPELDAVMETEHL